MKSMKNFLLLLLLTISVNAHASFWQVQGRPSFPTMQQSADDKCGTGFVLSTAPGPVIGEQFRQEPLNKALWNFGCYRAATDSHSGEAAQTGLFCSPGVMAPSDTGICPTDENSQCPAVGTVSGHGMEVYVSGLSVEVCTKGCGYTAAGTMHVGGDRYIAFGPYTATGPCTPSPTGPPEVPDERCSYFGPTGKCEAACPPGSKYAMVPTGAMACVKSLPPGQPDQPDDKTCPRGYINISPDPSHPNCAPTGDLGDSNPNGPANCPPGQHSQSTNGGASYCVFDKNDQQPRDQNTSQTPETTTNNPDGSQSKTKSTTTTNKDGSQTTTTTTTTTNADGSTNTSTKTETTKTPDGKEGQSDGQPEDKYNLCKQMPGLNICKNSSIKTTVGTDGCAKSTCEGDAIQCAILQMEQAEFCANNKTNEQSTYGNNVLSGNDPLASSLPTKDNGQTIEMPSTLDQSGFLGGGSCFPDKSFSLMGHQFTLSFSEACQALLIFRYVMLIIALLISLRVVGGVMVRS